MSKVSLWYEYGDTRSFARLTADMHFSTVVQNDTMRDTQTQADGVIMEPCRVERIKNLFLVRRRNTTTTVFNDDRNFFV